MNTTLIALFAFLALLLLGLSIYLGVLLAQLKRQKNNLLRKAQENAIKEQELWESLRIISLATLQNQCELSEACIRIYNLLQRSEAKFDLEELPKLSLLFSKLQNLSYLEERQKLSAQERFNEDKIRYQIEDEFRDSVLPELELLHSRISSLKTSSLQ